MIRYSSKSSSIKVLNNSIRSFHMTKSYYNKNNNNNSSLQKFQFETNNDEFYIAKNSNSFYQNNKSIRPNFKGETFKLQDSLPSLPVPNLNDTVSKYLTSVKPFTNNETQVIKQKELCDDFLNGIGPTLQQRLQKYATGKRNWMAKLWDSQAYLNYNDPVIPYVSYFYNHAPLSSITHSIIETNQLLKSTALISEIIKFIESIKDESLNPELIRGTPFCMNSFHLMFNNSRVPNVHKKDNKNVDTDTNVFYSIYENNFMIITIDGNFYKMATHDANNNPLPNNIIYNQLKSIINQNNNNNTNTNSGIGSLTSLPRDEWNNVYTELIKDPLAKESLETIHRASFMLCLDVNENPVTLEAKSRNSWHGDGINRYYDKALQFFVTKNGKSGFLGEHSKMDGTPTLFLNTFICQELKKINQNEFLRDVNLPIDTSISMNNSKPELLQFTITPTIKENIEIAQDKFKKLINEHDLNVWNYQKYGKNFIKQFKLSPDAYIQQIIQLAVFKYLGRQLPTYEAASTRKFFKGRTETGRSVTQESKDFVTAWNDPTISIADKVKLLRESIKAHSNYLKMASDGQAIDRHFFGLKNMLTEKDNAPLLFNDPLFKYSSTWYISTSQLSGEHFDGYGWSQVNDAGFGLAYMVNKEWLAINIVNKPTKSGLDGKKLRYYLTEAADEIAQALKQTQQADLKATQTELNNPGAELRAKL